MRPVSRRGKKAPPGHDPGVHVLLVRNKAAGSASAVDPAELLARRGCTVTTTDVATAARWSRRPPSRKLATTQRVVVAGGDGSIGCSAALAVALDVPLGIVPAGTANDFARAMRLPTNLEQACMLAATGDDLRDVELGRVGALPFVNVASLGLAPAAADAAVHLKRPLRSLAYPAGALLAMVRSRPLWLRAQVDGETAWSGRAWQAMVASTGAFGGWASTGGTRPGDGKLDLLVVPAERRGRHLAADAASLLVGELAQRDGVVHLRGTQITIRTRRRPRMVVDGERIRAASSTVEARLDERPVRVVVG